jgi:hypothetical protein
MSKVEPMRSEFGRSPERAAIRLTLRALLDAHPALTRLATDKLPVKLAYSVARMVKVTQGEVDEFLTQRNALVRQYGLARAPLSDLERQTHGAEVIEVMPEHLEAYRRDIDALTSVEVTIPRDPLVLDDVDKIAAADLLALGPLVYEPE